VPRQRRRCANRRPKGPTPTGPRRVAPGHNPDAGRRRARRQYLSEDIGRLIPRAETVILRHGGHFFPVTEANEFRLLVVEFLTR
jgi:hypothetical protein